MSPANSLGFTLIELMVVIVIMMTMFAFVSPLGIEQINRAKAQQELHEAIRILQSLSTKAYASGTTIKLEFNNNRIIARDLDKVRAWQFEQLYFSNQTVNFNRNGYVDSSYINYTLSEEVRQLNLMSEIIINKGAYTYAP
ncbi:Tfp pilus assembly protein FimT/FimU [Colwellia sp. RSH04]|uniref:pilus assembly FimT family protein n=1 Tax=Colwellia sp. RSH04 TaxID=2305464 RepID=UPI000E56F0A2|nr:type II secretion system protein [Colwellia sp. RSH04]RHW74869.1 type II secretion system protein [Colwellia sp. RSH04]